ncbi:MAG: hypothetical protein ACRDSP_16305 [Pseudonocardiaceae bacterium]
MSRREALLLLSLLASFVVTGYAGVRLLAGHPLGVGAWFLGSAVVHDLVLFPLYVALDVALVTLLRRSPAIATVRGVPWLNHLRVPAVISGLLLMVWSPLILQLATAPAAYTAASGLSTQPYLARWLAVTTALFATSVLLLAIRVVRANSSPGPVLIRRNRKRVTEDGSISDHQPGVADHGNAAGPRRLLRRWRATGREYPRAGESGTAG